MRKFCGASLVACLIIGWSADTRAEDQPEARAIVEKAIKAMGRDTKAAQVKAANWKGKGKFYGLGEGIEYTGEWWVVAPDKTRVDVEIDIMGMKIKMTRAIDGDKGWTKTLDEVKDMEKDEIIEEKHTMYTGWVAQLYPLQDKAFELSMLGESKVEGRPAVGVKVSRKGQRDVNLYFDKETFVLLKNDTRVKDLMGGGAELTSETIYSDLKETDGVKDFRKFTIKRDGKTFIDFEFTEFKRLEKLDDSVFKQ